MIVITVIPAQAPEGGSSSGSPNKSSCYINFREAAARRMNLMNVLRPIYETKFQFINARMNSDAETRKSLTAGSKIPTDRDSKSPERL